VDGTDTEGHSGGAGKGIVADLGVMTALGTAAWVAAVVALYPAYRGYYRELGIPLSRAGVDTTFMLARAGAVALLAVVCGTLLLVVAASVVVMASRRRLSVSNVRTVIRRSAIPVAMGTLVLFVPSVLWTWWSAEALGEEVVRTGDAPSDARVNRLLDLHTFAVVLSPLDGDPVGLCEQSWFATLVAEDDTVAYVLLRPGEQRNGGYPTAVVTPLAKADYAVIRVRDLPAESSEGAAWPSCATVHPAGQD
jgi:hypothetical protein